MKTFEFFVNTNTPIKLVVESSFRYHAKNINLQYYFSPIYEHKLKEMFTLIEKNCMLKQNQANTSLIVHALEKISSNTKHK